MPWYSERLTPLGAWAPQITPAKPTERTNEGRTHTLRRVRELQPHEAHLSVGALFAAENDRAALAWDRAQDDALAARDMVMTGIGE
ncbi:hypothetical protein [Roseinatronobacter sp.]